MLGTRHSTGRALALLAAALMVSSGPIGLVAIASNASAAEESVLRIGFTQRIDSLNPLVGMSDTAWVYYGLVYDTPQCIGDDLEIVPNLVAETRAVPATDPDMVASGEPYGSVWEYTISTNAHWHDGEPFTVQDLLFNFNINAEDYDYMWANQPYSYFMSYAEEVGPDTVRVHYFDRSTGEPKAAAYAKMIGIPLLPYHKVKDMTVSYLSFDWSGVFEGEDTAVVGTGPFMAMPDILEKLQNNEPITLVRNPDYHWTADKGLEVKFDKVELRFFSDPSAMAEALTDGTIDVAQLPPEEFDSVRMQVEDGTLADVETYSGLKCTNYFTEVAFNMNEDGPNMARLDPAVRQALATATDKESIVSEFYLGYAEEGSTMISPIDGDWHYEPTASEKFPYDPSEARAILEDAGYRYPNASSTVRVATEDSLAVKNGWVQDGTELRFQMMVRREFPEERAIAAYLETQWASIGVDVNYVVTDEAELGKVVYYYAYDMMMWYWSSDIDPNYMLFCQSSHAWGGWSDNMYFNESYEENYSRSVSEMNPVLRKGYVDSCLRTHYRDAAYIILAYNYQTYAWRTDTFTGWGDWAAEPGRSIDNFWTGNPLWFDLEPVSKGPDMTLYMIIAGAACAGAVAAVAVLVFRRRKGKAKGKAG